VSFHLWVDQMNAPEVSEAARESKFRFQGLESSGFSPLFFREADHAGDSLDLLDEIDVGQLSVSRHQRSIALQAPADGATTERQLNKNFSAQVALQRSFTVDFHVLEYAPDLGREIVLRPRNRHA